MSEDSTFGFKGFAILFAFLVIGFAGAQSEPGGKFDLLTKVVRKVPVKKTATTSPTPPPTTTTSNTIYSELTAVPSQFDINSGLGPAWGTGNIAPSSAPDPVGAFRFQCAPGQVAWVDPVVNPGTRSSHLHQFFGNLNVTPDSNYQSLRGNGGSSCESDSTTPGRALNRSAYWMPAMLDGKGSVVRPDFLSVYYKRRPASDPRCSLSSGDPQAGGDCVPLPNGLRFVFGYDMVTGTIPTGSVTYECMGPTSPGNTKFATLAEVANFCPLTSTPVKQWDGSFKETYNRIGVTIFAPSCWDGVNLDSPNHRSHVAYDSYGDWGYNRCPSTHPKVIPSFSMGAWYRVDENLKTWRLSSDAMHPNLPAGSTFHADWFGAWDNQVMSMWMDNCINKRLNCSGGDLGNGKQIYGMWGTWEAIPRLVPVPA